MPDPSGINPLVGRVAPPQPMPDFNEALGTQANYEQLTAYRKARIDAASDAAATQAALQQANGDPQAAIGHLMQSGKANAAGQLQKMWDAHLGEVEKQTDQHLKIQQQQAQFASNLARGITDEHSFQAVKSIVAPQYAQMLGDTYDPARIQAIQQSTLTAKELADQQHQAHVDLLAAGTDGEKQYQALLDGLGAIRDQDTWQKALQIAAARPGADKARIAALPQQFSPDALKYVQDAAVSQETREKRPLAAAQTEKTIAEAKAEPVKAQADLTRAQTAAKSAAAAGGLEPEALDQAAERYYQTGTLPAGMGPAALTRNNAIMNRSGVLHAGANLAANSAAFKANQSSLTNVTRTLDTLTAFENTAGKNLQQFLDLAEKIPDTGVPWANVPVRAITRGLLGDKAQAGFEAARDVALREIARVTNDPKLSGQLTDSARAEVQNLSPSSATLGQIKAVANVLVKDMANVHSSLQAQKDDIQQRLGSAPAASGGTALMMTSAELAALAKMHGITVEQERANATAAGYTIR